MRIVFSKSTQQAVSERSSEYSRWVVLKFSVATGQQIFENSLFNFSFGSSYTGYVLLEGDDIRQDSAVKHELHVLGGVAGDGVLSDDVEEGWLVP